MNVIEKTAAGIVPDAEKSGIPEGPVTFAYRGAGADGRNTVTLTPRGKVPAGQDGAVFGDLLFRFDSKGNGTAFDLGEGREAGRVTLEGLDVLCPHSNSVSFGPDKFAETDVFPLLYTNVYNTYASADDRREGYCCVFRVRRDADGFTGTPVQVIRIGFVTDLAMWESLEDKKDVRPYGNFAVDAGAGKLYAFVMRDAEKVTRFFEFDLPSPDAGEDGIIPSVKVVTLGKEDVRSRFDTEYVNYMQGACARGGLIYSVEGFTDARRNSPPALRVIDAKNGRQTVFADLFANGFRFEPELITFYGDGLLYSDNQGDLFGVEFGK